MSEIAKLKIKLFMGIVKDLLRYMATHRTALDVKQIMSKMEKKVNSVISTPLLMVIPKDSRIRSNTVHHRLPRTVMLKESGLEGRIFGEVIKKECKIHSNEKRLDAKFANGVDALTEGFRFKF
ncbi:hypothetical protein P5673_024230 [Acropora cervicornis]|uniref:Uncharacterized protein n=1 Tax=Acropora cervicornis TaxID=6130 RepID=A0AAD9Q3T1_ACRCE|nr:hypothetical protein P5673_024230 [Acropora cervicornis]